LSFGFAASAFRRIFISSTAFIFGVITLLLDPDLALGEEDAFVFSIAF
jgi:hypothetical protein